MRRRGFTLLELLIAGALGACVLGLAMQQLTAYMHVQQSLMARAELRAGLNLGLERLASRLRGALVVDEAGGELLAIAPNDDDHDGVLGPADHMTVSDWRLSQPFPAGDSPVLQERDVTVPAFEPPLDPVVVLTLFQSAMGRARTLAPAVSRLEGQNLAGGLWLIKLTGERALPHEPPVSVSASQWVAPRSTLAMAHLPTFQAMLAQLKGAP